MRTLYKRITTVVLAATMILTLPAAGLHVKADAATGADPDDVYHLVRICLTKKKQPLWI